MWTRRRNGKAPSRDKSPNNAARTPSRLHAVLDGGNCSRARHFDLTFKKQLRQHGFESPERPCAASADEQERTCCATKHLKRRPDNLKYYSFYIQRRLKCTTTGARLHALRADFKPFVPPPNGLRYLRVGGRGQNFGSRILFGCRKSPKMAQNPTRQVHALLGAF